MDTEHSTHALAPGAPHPAPRGATTTISRARGALARALGRPVGLTVTAVVAGERWWLAGSDADAPAVVAWSPAGPAGSPEQLVSRFADGDVAVCVAVRAGRPVRCAGAAAAVETTAAALVALLLEHRAAGALAQEHADLRTAMRTRSVIDQAMGVVMAQDRCGPERALQVLRRASQRRNQKVSVVAALLVEGVSGAPPAPPEFRTRPG